jgi:3-phenylpropionate/cinnamic acid dioxygenase small subunit
MPKKLLLKIILTLSLTVSPMWSLQAQPDTAKYYTLPRWKYVNVLEKAFTKLIYDSLIDSLEFRVQTLETEKKSVYSSFNAQIGSMREVQVKQKEIITYQESLTNFYKAESRKYKNQRNIGITAVIAYTVVRIGVKVFKPP